MTSAGMYAATVVEQRIKPMKPAIANVIFVFITRSFSCQAF